MNSMTLEQTMKTASVGDAVKNTLYSYVQLMKPCIVLFFTLTGVAGLMTEGTLRSDPMRFWMIVLGTLLTAGSANTINQYIDRDIDAVMERTKKERPLPMGLITPTHALIYAVSIGVIATAILYYWGNLLTASLGVATIAFYIGVYTLWLKRTTPHNIVIGGAAGATAPLIGWAAANGSLSWAAFAMFLIIFVWTPPHFWALALCIKDEYAGVDVPMLPVVAGEEVTRRQMLFYTLLMLPITIVPFLVGASGPLYLIAALLLGAEFLRRMVVVYRVRTKEVSWKLFAYSIVYLLALFTVMIIDAVVKA